MNSTTHLYSTSPHSVQNDTHPTESPESGNSGEAPLLPVLEFLQRRLAGNLAKHHRTHMNYPTAISTTLGFELVAVELGRATLAMKTDPALHGNQQGTVHGGLIAELADAAFGTAHSTRVLMGESFTSIELKINFLRPVWNDRLQATAHPVHAGRSVSHYHCDILREDGKLVATAQSVVMTLRGEQAVGR